MKVETVTPVQAPPPSVVQIELSEAEATGLKAFIAKYHDCNKHPTACALVTRLPGDFSGTREHV